MVMECLKFRTSWDLSANIAWVLWDIQWGWSEVWEVLIR